MFLAITLAQAGVVDVSSVTASRTLPDDEGVSYAEQNTQDHKQSTVWVEGDTSGSGLGDWIQFDFDGEVTLTSFRVWNGNFYSYDFWNRHNRIKELELEFSDGTKQVITLTDEMAPELVTLEKPVKTSSVKMKIKGIYRGSTFNDTVISEVIFFDQRSDGRVPVKAYQASTVYPADADGSYDPKNLGDGAVDSLWCEGVEDGDGTGEWVQLDFGRSHTISKLELVNGNAYNIMYFMKGNRATEMTLSFSDGSTQTVAVKGSPSLQTIAISPVSTSAVRMTFTAVQTGKEFNDLCIAEAVFVE
ncbi:MAG TPA: discoidin domain-containing protein [Myxococcota bacterium]|nr:discoidin domain-containing protein [Myxococcota bacterium]